MSASAEHRKRVELLAKLRSVTADLDFWLQVSDEGAPAKKHHTQIRRVAAQLRPLAAQIELSIDDGSLITRWLAVEENVMDLHRVWGFFREKLALRRLEELAPFLLLADEFSWACYEPAQLAATAGGRPKEEIREPPLVYLTSEPSPFSVSRGESYAQELGAAGLTTRSARLLVSQLPVPVIGIPWFQVHHLPDAMVIGHEVGHLVANELIGVPTLRQLVESALPDAETATRWGRWTEESFADIYGALCGGDAYGVVLADFLRVADLERAPADPSYPPAAARLRLVEAVIAEARSAEEDGVDGSDVAPAAEEAVARALVRGPYPCFGGRRLDEVIPVAAQGGSQPEELLQGWDPETKEIRTLLAVTAHAFADDPDRYAGNGVQDRVLRRARKIEQPGTRYRGNVDVDDRAILDRDRARGAELYRLLVNSRP